jgi:hypothetical protein
LTKLRWKRALYAINDGLKRFLDLILDQFKNHLVYKLGDYGVLTNS